MSSISDPLNINNNLKELDLIFSGQTNKQFDIDNLKYKSLPLNKFLEKKYKKDINDINKGKEKLNLFFNEYSIPSLLFNFITKGLKWDKIEKLFKEFFQEEREFNFYSHRKYTNILRSLNLENVFKIGVRGSVSLYDFIYGLNRGNILHRVFMLFNNFKLDTKHNSLTDSYIFIRTQLKRGSILNPYLISKLLNKYKGENLLSLVHSWQSYQLGFYKSKYKKYYINDLNNLENNIKKLDNYVKTEFKSFGEDKKVISTLYDFSSKELYDFYKDKKIDTTIVCPPYYDLEEYDNKSGKQSGEKDYESFLLDMEKMIDNGIGLTNKYFILILANSKKYKIFSHCYNYIKNKYGENKIIEKIKTNVKANINQFNILEDGEFCIVFEK